MVCLKKTKIGSNGNFIGRPAGSCCRNRNRDRDRSRTEAEAEAETEAEQKQMQRQRQKQNRSRDRTEAEAEAETGGHLLIGHEEEIRSAIYFLALISIGKMQL